MKTVRVVCAHDCPDRCLLMVDVDGGCVLRARRELHGKFVALADVAHEVVADLLDRRGEVALGDG